LPIQPIDCGGTCGVQVRVARKERTLTRFLSYNAHGGLEATIAKAKKIEAAMEQIAGPKATKLGRAYEKPSKSSRTDVPGISARYRMRNEIPVLHITVVWMEGNASFRRQRKTDYSTEIHGLLGAVQCALDKRLKMTGLPQMSAEKAWLKIKKSLEK